MPAIVNCLKYSKSPFKTQVQSALQQEWTKLCSASETILTEVRYLVEQVVHRIKSTLPVSLWKVFFPDTSDFSKHCLQTV